MTADSHGGGFFQSRQANAIEFRYNPKSQVWEPVACHHPTTPCPDARSRVAGPFFPGVSQRHGGDWATRGILWCEARRAGQPLSLAPVWLAVEVVIRCNSRALPKNPHIPHVKMIRVARRHESRRRLFGIRMPDCRMSDGVEVTSVLIERPIDGFWRISRQRCRIIRRQATRI